MATKVVNILDRNSCFNKADDQEPIFVLRANDRVAADVILIWAQRYMMEKGGKNGWLGMSEEQQGKYKNALNVVEEFKLWVADDDIPF